LLYCASIKKNIPLIINIRPHPEPKHLSYSVLLANEGRKEIEKAINPVDKQITRISVF